VRTRLKEFAPPFVFSEYLQSRLSRESAEANQRPASNVFSRRDGKIYHTYCAELMFAPADPGQNQRHVDVIWPVWNIFDYAPEGCGTDRYRKLKYGPAEASVQLAGAAETRSGASG
jgi:predicted dithiol-disulfide oxidoreductase (DUF899 family)